MEKVKVGLIGSQFVSTIHAEAFKKVADAELVAAASPTEAHVKEFAAQYGSILFETIFTSIYAPRRILAECKRRGNLPSTNFLSSVERKISAGFNSSRRYVGTH